MRTARLASITLTAGQGSRRATSSTNRLSTMNEPPSPVTLKQAAQILRVDVSTLRRDIVAGCPTVELGGVGRGKGTLVDVDAVRRWRASTRGDVLPLLASALTDLFREAIYEDARITPPQAVLLFVKIYERVFERLMRHMLLPEDLPPEMKRLCAICLDSIERGNFHQEE